MDAGCFGYITDISSKEERTKKISIAAGMISLSLTLGYYFGGFINGLFEDPTDSYYVIFFTSLAICIIGIIYTLFMEQSVYMDPEKRTPFFQLSHIVDCIRTVFKQGENQAQILVAIFVFGAANMALITTDFEYMMSRLKYKEFDRSLFTYYSGTKTALDCLSVLLLLPIVLSMAKISDLAMIAMGLLSTTIGFLVVMLSDESWPGASTGWPLWVLAATVR